MDFPPLVGWVAWVVRGIAGDSLEALRLTSLACGAASVLLVAAIARELGGSWRAQLGAAGLWALTPFVLGSASIFHPTWLDLLAWTAALYLAVRILARPAPRLWPLLGFVVGVGLEAKYTILAIGVALGVGLLTRVDVLRTRGPWLAAGAAALVLTPNLVWQARHGWPSVHFFASQNAKTSNDTSRPQFVAQQLLFLGGAAPLAIAGVVALWRDRRMRPLAVVPVVATLFFFLERGRSYYPLPGDSVALAAGAVALDRWVRSRGPAVIVVAGVLVVHAAILALAIPIVVPVRGTASMVSSGVWQDSFYDDEIGWPELAAQTGRAWRALPVSARGDSVVLAGNYGEAGALSLYGRRLGLPPPLSGHLSWQFWRPRDLPQGHALVVGYNRAFLERVCSSWRRMATIENRWRLGNEERGRTIDACTLRAPLERLWHVEIARSEL